MTTPTNRRSFLKRAAALSAGASLACRSQADALVEPQVAAAATPARKPGTSSVAGLTVPALPIVRMAIIGAGGRGTSLLGEFLRLDGVEVLAVADLHREHVERAQAMCTQANRRAPDGYFAGETDYRRIYERGDIDLVIIATPWKWHVPMAVEAMTAGIHAGVEVPAAITVEGAWELVETAERTRRHCMMLENVCYGESELAVLNMCRQGLFGELLHGEAAYIHDLREILFAGHGESDWRRQHSIDRNGNLYPTHGLGPISQYMGINRGDRFERLVSMSSNSRGMGLFAAQRFGPESPEAKATYRCGDMNTTMIQTARGRSIVVQHDTTSPRPYDRINLIQGTSGTFRGFHDRVYVEGRSPGHAWEDGRTYVEQYRHPLWQKVGALATEVGGHGGMDFVMAWRLVYCLRNGLSLDQDVYDAAAWSVISPLSEASVAAGSGAVAVPDFTRGEWEQREALGVVS